MNEKILLCDANLGEPDLRDRLVLAGYDVYLSRNTIWELSKKIRAISPAVIVVVNGSEFGTLPDAASQIKQHLDRDGLTDLQDLPLIIFEEPTGWQFGQPWTCVYQRGHLSSAEVDILQANQRPLLILTEPGTTFWPHLIDPRTVRPRINLGAQDEEEYEFLCPDLPALERVADEMARNLCQVDELAPTAEHLCERLGSFAACAYQNTSTRAALNCMAAAWGAFPPQLICTSDADRPDELELIAVGYHNGRRLLDRFVQKHDLSAFI